MDATEPNQDGASEPRSGVEVVSEHWVCAACGTYDGPIAGDAFCDYCADGSTVYRVVPQADAEALAHAVSATLNDNCRTCGKPRDIRLLLMCRACVESGVPIPDTHDAQSTLATALSEYLAKHPWSDL